MCCERLVCARCAGPASEARCPVCLAARADVHTGQGMSVATLVALLTVLALLATLVEVALGR
jgi:hypothetical protein